MKRLPDTELEVIKALWDSGPQTPRMVLEEKLAHYGWAVNTINTYLTRLVNKGFISVEHRRSGNLYTPLVSREEYQAFDSRATLSQLYGSPRNFVAALARDGLKHNEKTTCFDMSSFRLDAVSSWVIPDCCSVL